MLTQKFSAAGQASAEDEFSPGQVRAFLSGLPGGDPKRSARLLIARLVALNGASMPARARLRALGMFRDHVDWLLPQLEIRVAKVTPPIAAPLREAAYAIEKLLKELAAGYSRAVFETPRSWLPMGLRKKIHVPLTRAMDFHARRLALSQRLYARSPSGVWIELHRLFQLARECGVASQEIESPRTSPLRVYRDALLLAFAEPSKLMHGDFSRVQGYLAAHAELAEIVAGRKFDEPLCVFAIDPRRDKPGIAYAKRGDAGFENGALVLLTHRLVERLDSQLKRLRGGIPPGTLGLPEEARMPAYRELMERLAVHWRGERKPRTARTRFHPRVELWVGLREIWRSLRAEAPFETPQADITARELPVRASDWIIVNESSRGFALKFMSGALPPISVGEIVAVKPKEGSAAFVCLVRWVQSNGPEHFEIGLQQLAPFVLPAVYRAGERKPVAAEPVLFLPQVPAQKRASAIVAPPDRVDRERPFTLRHGGARLSLQAHRVIERTQSVELIEVEAAGITAAA